jgi:lysophospholipase L1-like esterase
MSGTTRRILVAFAAAVLLVLVATVPASAKALTPTLHPKAAPLPLTHQGPFVTTGDGGVLCVDTLLLDGMHPNDEGHRIIAELLVPVIREQVR